MYTKWVMKPSQMDIATLNKSSAGGSTKEKCNTRIQILSGESKIQKSMYPPCYMVSDVLTYVAAHQRHTFHKTHHSLRTTIDCFIQLSQDTVILLMSAV